jgi:hypothetical protein
VDRYRLRVEVQDEPTIGSTACIFKHPVQPGSLAGGWMVHSRDEPHPPRAPDCDAAMDQRIGRHIPTSEIQEVRPSASYGALLNVDSSIHSHILTHGTSRHAQHNKEDDCWVVIDGRVFDLTTYLKDHPGGIIQLCLAGGCWS